MLTGGERQGSLLAPAVLADVQPSMKISGREGPRYAVQEMTEPRLLVQRPLGAFDS